MKIKITRDFVSELKKSAEVEIEKSYRTIERQRGVVGLCEYLLANADLQELQKEEKPEGEKEN